MKSVAYDQFFEGAVSVERGDGWLKPWRLPHAKRLLFPSPDDALFGAAGMPSCVRLRFKTDSTSVKLIVQPLGPHAGDSSDSRFDMTIDNEIVATTAAPPGSDCIAFDELPTGDKTVELWLPPGVPVAVKDLQIADDAVCSAAPDHRKRWVTYGSSLTHCVRANSSARVWPAIVARKYDLHVTSLGFGGQCHMDPMVAMTLRDLPADLISLKMGINVIGHGSLSMRTFAAAIMGLIQIVREKHPTTPIALVTSFACTPRETAANNAGLSLSIMREQTIDVYNRLVAYGDKNIMLFDGLQIVDEESLDKYSEDRCHHNGDGIEEIAERWSKVVMSRIAITDALSAPASSGNS